MMSPTGKKAVEKSRDASKPCEPLVRSLRRLQEVLNMSLNCMMSRLEMIAKQLGVGFHRTETTCYLTVDLFYVEVLLLPCGKVKEVNVAPHGKSPTVSQCLLQLLRSEKFSDFSAHLTALFAQYNIPGNKVSECSDSQMDIINNGTLGSVIAEKLDCPLTIKFFVPPSHGMKTSESCLEVSVHTAHVTVGASDVSHKLQMASVLLQPPQLDLLGRPLFMSKDDVPHETFPACFLLRLQPSLPMMRYFVEKLGDITDVAIPESSLQWAPLTKLLSLPGGVVHSHIFSEAAWDVPAHRGAMMDRVPFTSPAHLPALLEVLRHQCVINTLLRSCFTVEASCEGSVCDLHFEVLPESDVSLSVTFQLPDMDSLSVLLVNINDPRRITCRLYGAGSSDSSINNYICTVIKSCMSIPGTMRILYRMLQDTTSVPLSPGCLVATQAETDRSAPPGAAVTDTSRDLATFSRGAATPADDFTISGLGFIMPRESWNVFPNDTKPSSVNLYPSVPAGPLPKTTGNDYQ